VNATVDPEAADFHLRPDSPAINFGTAELKPGAQTQDFDGTARPQSGRYDAGAYEYCAQTQSRTASDPDAQNTAP
jgi:hypothetical protein